jgi:hypothetical protein
MIETALKVALKEWDVVCDALCRGEQHILLRKGGILESGGEFELEEKQFLLYPTFIHQDPASLKPPCRTAVSDIRTEPETIHFPGWASVEKIFRVPGRHPMDRLYHLHVWDTPLIDMRFNYRPQYPLYLILLRTWKFEHRPQIANAIEFAGCKSWVPLPQAIAIHGSTPVCSDKTLADIQAQIVEAFST